ncbi:MAG: YggT family protein [SAR202 cluster bacterium]|nr:YggT family protein [SAR202 cluster bacterium]
MVGIINGILFLFTLAIFARVILSFVMQLSAGRPHPVLVSINLLVNQITEPVLGPIRKSLPSFGGFDFSPMVVLIILILLRKVVDAAL